MKINKHSIENVLFKIFVVLLPTQTALHFWPDYSFVFGIRVDYLSPAVYATDLLIISMLVLWVARRGFKIVKRPIFLSLIFVSFFVAFVNIITSSVPIISLYRWLKILEALMLVLYLRNLPEDTFIKSIKLLVFSAVGFSLLGLSQFLKGGTLGGVFYFLGERNFNMATPGIALVNMFGQNYLRVYSTFSHPNSMAGYLGVILILLLGFRKTLSKYLLYFGGAVVLACFLLTFSLSSCVALIACIIFVALTYKSKTKVFLIKIFLFISILFSLSLPLFSRTLYFETKSLGESFYLRADFNFIAGEMIAERPLLGEGLGTFVSNVNRFKGLYSYQWWLQPVHNIFLLLFAEVGIFGGLLLVGLPFFFLKNERVNKVIVTILLFVLFTGLFDHYWLTLQQNLFLLAYVLGYSQKHHH